MAALKTPHRRNNTLSHSLVRNHLHVVFSTKYRRPIIPREIQPDLWRYMAGICRNIRIAPFAINGFDDHAHMLFHLPAALSLARAMSVIKANSNGWMHRRGRRFEWQDGYSAFSVSHANTAAVAEYIRNQEAHHRRITFADELRMLLRENGVELSRDEFEHESAFV